MKCPHCGEEIPLRNYDVRFICSNGKGGRYETGCIFEAYSEEDAVDSAKQFDEGFIELVSVKEVQKK